MDAESDRQTQDYSSHAIKCKKQRNDQIDQYLRCAMCAFTAHWLPLVTCEYPATEVQDIIRDSWRACRRDMLKVINRPSYRSILALYLFAQTPLPVGVSENEELDGISGPVCMQNAFYQLQRLRERRGSSQTTEITLESPAQHADIESQHMNLESTAYWAAILWDTSSSLSLGHRTSLTSGLKGACSEPTWRLVESFLVGYFTPRSEFWRTEGVEVTNEVAYEIIAGAIVCKTYIWKNITSLKEALREGVDEDSMPHAWNALLEVLKIYKISIRPLLHACERRLHFLDQHVRLNWFGVKLKYCLGIFVLVDALEAAG
jgi:hypothetical protein